MRMEFLWLALIVVFAVIEGATTALTTVWFIGGAPGALGGAPLLALFHLSQPPRQAANTHALLFFSNKKKQNTINTLVTKHRILTNSN